MGDYGRKPLFGMFVEPAADPPDRAARLARVADRAALYLIGIQDQTDPQCRRH